MASHAVSTDSRNIQSNQIYFALKGKNFDGNLYAPQALSEGALIAVIDREIGVNHPKLIKVDDSLKALQQLAEDYRNHLNIPILAITGSNGKTTCKELIRDVLSKKFKVTATQGNLNNHIGIPLTILSIPLDCEFAVIEMGANHCREISGYCEYTRPNFGYITNIGLAHLEGFGGESGVIRGKSELFDYVFSNGGIIFADIHQPKMEKALQNKPYVSTSIQDIGVNISAEEPTITYKIKGINEDVTTKFAGSYNIMNIAAAIGIGRYFEVNESSIHEAIANYTPNSNRSEIRETASNRIIMDAYNANPTSMEHAIRSFSRMKAPNKLVILGDMKELGIDSLQLHQAVVNIIDELSLKAVFIGESFNRCQIPKKCNCYNNIEEFSKLL
ncbi:MAG: UDP-N-acetylmuramoyl-tripeptide--D-alanyl-D-alanine ligase, partial [Flavobacteriales bacterium]